MWKKYSILFLVCSLFLLRGFSQKAFNVKEQIAEAEKQYALMLQTHPDTSKTPFSTAPDGKLKDMPSDWWCSGFFGGSLWYLFEYTKNTKWKEAANLWSLAVEKEQYNKGTHDLGFMLYCPFGNGYRLTGNAGYKSVLLNGANSLSTRFDPRVGLIKSWNKLKEFNYPVIIDNMMNLELLFWASHSSGDNRFRQIAITHADNTLKNHFRADNSSYHVVCYDSTGKVLAKITAQGAADGSAWARGQAWGLYGYTVMFRETKDRKYLAQAIKIADFILHHPNLPNDKIPYWDFNAPNIPNEERDASAAAVTASALLELVQYCNKTRSQEYFKAAELMLRSLSDTTYRAKTGENNNFLIKHCVGHKPQKSEVDVPLVYADYYYLEALLRYDKVKQ